MVFIIFISFIIILRLGELLHSRSNEKWLLQNGAVEFGKKHYPVIVTLHVLFIISLLVEYSTQTFHAYNLFLIILYLILLVVKARVILTLGKFWNTKIYHIPHAPLVKKGIYKYIKHPNYMIVISEIALIPLSFHLYYTAFIFSILNGIVLFIRIKAENKALQL